MIYAQIHKYTDIYGKSKRCVAARRDQPDETWEAFDVPDHTWLSIKGGKIVASTSPPAPNIGEPTENWRFDPECIKQRPILAAHIGTIAAMWAQIETSLGNLLSKMLGTDAGVGTAMYLAIVSEQARTAALEAAAKEKLPSEFKEKFSALIKSLKSPRKKRNIVVHGLWAISDGHPDSLILIDSNKFIRMWSANHAVSASTKSEEIVAAIEKMTEAFKEHHSSVLEYRAGDFIRIEEDILQASQKIGKFDMELSRFLHPELLPKEPLK